MPHALSHSFPACEEGGCKKAASFLMLGKERGKRRFHTPCGTPSLHVGRGDRKMGKERGKDRCHTPCHPACGVSILKVVYIPYAEEREGK